MKKSHVYEAQDGKHFSTAQECRAHENSISFALLWDLKPTDIDRAIERTNRPLADAFERIGNIIAKERRMSGGLKRVVNKEKKK